MLRLVLTLFALACLVGCRAMPLPGVADVAIEFRIRGFSDTPQALERAVSARLAAARVSADVEVASDRLRVVVDRASEDVVRELLRWEGGVALFAEAPNDRPLVGPPDRVEAAAEAAGSSGPIRYFVEPLGPELARTRAGRAEPLATLEPATLAKVEVAADGKSVRFEVDAKGRTLLDSAIAAVPKDPLLVVRDGTLLGPLTNVDAASFVVPVGDGLYAYTRADRVRALLATPGLPRLEHVATTAMPFDVSTLAVGLLLPIVLSAAWLAFVRRLDRLHPEPLWLVATVFVLGALSVVPAAMLEVAFARSSIALNPTYASMGGRLSAFPYALAVFTLVVGFSEEASKLAAALFVRRRREFDEPIDGIVYGVSAALGFAAVENIKYFATGRLAPSLVLARTFTSIPAHFFLGALWGFALGQTLLPGRRKTIVLEAFVVACIVHGAFDAMLSTRGLAPVALLVNFGLASTFVVLVRKALRRSAVDGDAAPLSADRHAIVRVGSPLVFWFGAAAVHAGALASVVLGVIYEGSAARPGAWFFVASAFALGVLVIGAWAVSAALPLDVVVDAHGITFAGSLRRWEAIERVERMRSGPLAYLRIDSPEGELRIGPVKSSDAAALDALVASRVVTSRP